MVQDLFNKLFFEDCRRINIKLSSHNHASKIDEINENQVKNNKFYRES
jgi:hypothetical protein